MNTFICISVLNFLDSKRNFNKKSQFIRGHLSEILFHSLLYHLESFFEFQHFS